VTANCVAFGLIEVAGREIKAGIQPKMIDTIKRMTPLGRSETTEDAANGGPAF